MRPKASFVGSVYPLRSEDVDHRSNRPKSNCLFPLRKTSVIRPVVGATSQIIRSAKWYKDVSLLGMDAIEINRRYSKLHLNVYFLEKIRRYLQNVKVSLHSATTGVFQEMESFTQAELATLRAEVDVARFLGAREVVLHLNGRAVDDGCRQRMSEVIGYAGEKDVHLIYESDVGLEADHTCKVLEAFAEIGYALDLGHLNNGYRRNLLGCEIGEFISRVRDRTVYIHANNNSGRLDEHKGLNDGSLDWRAVLNALDMSRIRKIIIEVRSIEYLKDSQQELRNYLADSACKMV